MITQSEAYKALFILETASGHSTFTVLEAVNTVDDYIQQLELTIQRLKGIIHGEDK